MSPHSNLCTFDEYDIKLIEELFPANCAVTWDLFEIV